MAQLYPRRILQKLLFSFFLIAASFSITSAQNTWNGSKSTDWNDKRNWSANKIPAATDDVVIPNVTVKPSLTVGAAGVCKSLTINSGATLTAGLGLTVSGAVTIDAGATINHTANSIFVTGNWSCSGTYTGTTATTVVLNGTAQAISGTNVRFTKITVNANSYVTLNTNVTVNTSMVIDGTWNPNEAPSYLTSGSGSFTLGATGTAHVKAPLATDNYYPLGGVVISTGSTVDYSASSGTQTIYSDFTYDNLRISGGGIKQLQGDYANFWTSAADVGNVSVVAGTLDLFTFSLARGAAGGTLSVSNGATLRIGGTRSLPPFLSYSFGTTSTVEFYGSTQDIPPATYGNLTLSQTGTKTASGILNIVNDFTLTSANFVGGSYVHNIGRDWSMTSGTFNNTGTTIELNGTGAQSISSTGAFNILNLNKASGTTTITTDITANTLNFTNGVITTGANEIIIPSGGTVTGAAQTTGWINGNLQKYLPLGTTTDTYPLGTSLYYSPLSLSNLLVTTAGSLIVGITDGSHPNVSASTIGSKNISVYWTLSKPATGAIAFTSTSVGLTWNAAENYTGVAAAALIPAFHNGSAWSYPTESGTSTATSITATGITAMGSLAVGEVCPANVATFSYTGSPYCFSAGGSASPTYTGGGAAGVFSSTPAGLSINSAGQVNIAASTLGTYSVTNTVGVGSCANSVTSPIIIRGNLGAPTAITVAAGAQPTCQLTNGTTTTTYATTAANNGGFNWSLSNPSAGSITSGGVMTWADGFSGTVNIQVTANGCGGPSAMVTRPVTITPAPAPTPITISNGTEPTCTISGGGTKTTYATTATNSTGFTWSLSNAAAGTINATTGQLSWANGFTGSVNIQVTATGCNGPSAMVSRAVTVSPTPTTAAAGADQTGVATCGLTTVTLAGNTAAIGTGAWSIVSGAGGTITTPSSPTSTFSGTTGTTYTLRWTISNGCSSTTDDVIITFNRTPTAVAGTDQTGAATCGLTTVTLAAGTPDVGTGAWSIVSGTGGTIATPASPASTFSGTAGSSYTLRWTVTNAPCTAATDDILITFSAAATTAVAGPDQTGAATCGLTTVTLAGNAPTAGTGAWSIVSGTGGTIATPTLRTSTFSGAAGNSYTLRWTITNGPCISSDDVVVTFNRNPTTAVAGPDQTGAATCGLTTVTLAGNTPAVGTGAWSILAGTGGTITTPSSPTSTFSGTAGSTYTLTWTISNTPCTASADDVVIAFSAAPTTAAAGADQAGATTCGLTTVTLTGNTPTVGTGAWSIVSGTGGTITTPASATSTFTGTAGRTYTLRWTISNSPCTASTDDVVITFNRAPTTAAAGADQTGATTCGLTTVTLAGNAPTVGTGAWSVVSGAGGTITNSTSATSAFSGTAGSTYTLRWTISSSPCPASTDDVVITFNRTPTTAVAGADQTGAATCGLTTVTLAGNAPATGTGAWSIVSGTGGTVTTPSSATSTFTGTAGTTYTLRWTVSNVCSSSFDEVAITFNRNPTTAAAGTDQTGAATCGLTTVTLAANTPTIGTGAWSIVSGTGGTITTPTSATSTFTGTAGSTYTLRWTTSNSPCTASTDNVVVAFNQVPTTAVAGADQTGAATCGLTTVTLAANAPTIGTGTWSIVSGAGGTIAAPTSPVSTFSGTAGTTYTLTWTISNSPCTASTDNVVITFNQVPATAAAGADQTGAATCGLTTVTLAGNTPTTGTGAWSIVSGTGGTVTTPASATSTFSGTAATSYTLRWTISNVCASSSDDVTVTFNQPPTTAVAGTDQTGAATCGLTAVTLAGNTPAVGAGAWTIVSGTGGTITTPSSPASTFNGTAGNSYTLRWTISNSPCTASTDDVVITFNEVPTIALAGADQTDAATCGSTTITLAANTPSIGTGAWSVVSGTGGTIATPSSATSTFSGTAGTTYTLRWTISNGPCTPSTDDVVITLNRNPTTANAGPDQTGAITCGRTSVTLSGNTATVGTGAWSIVSGTGGVITSPSLRSSTFTGTAGSTYTLRWTISNSPCTASSDDVVITFSPAPTTANAGADQTGAATCGLTTVTLAGNTPTSGTGEWSIVSGTGGTITTPTSPTSTFSGTAGSTYTLRWTISNSPCTASTNDVVITFNQVPTTAVAGADQTGAVTCGLTTVTLAGNTPSIGTGAWTIVSGTGGTVTTPSSPTSTFSGTGGTSYTLKWTVSNSPCTAANDNVVITFNRNPTTANAGPDQTGAATCGVTTVTLAGNAPAVGTGAWSIVSGTGGSIATPANASSTFSGTAGTTYTLRWTTSNGSCTTSIDDVLITLTPVAGTPTAITGTPPTCQIANGTTSTTFASTSTNSTGLNWSISDASAGSIDATTGVMTWALGFSGSVNVQVTATGCSGPSAMVSRTIAITPAPSATISYPSGSYCNLGGNAAVTGTGTTGGTYSSTTGLALNATSGAVDLNSSTPGVYTVTYSVTGCAGVFTTTANITIVAKGTWTGAIDNDWNKPGNWTCGTMPAVITDITIPGTIATFPVIAAGSVAVNNLTLDAGASLTVTNATFVINGSVTDNGGSITANHGKVTFNGSTAQTIPAGLFASNTVKDLVINNPAGVTLAGTLRVAGILSFGNLNNNVFNTGGFLTLASTASGTGQVGDLTNNGTTTGNTINGMVTVERFVTPRRAYRFMTAPVNSTTIRQNWMENTNNATTSVNNNPVPGYGTHVTGSGGNVNGFDATATNNPSLFTFDNATQSWISATSTSLPLKAGIPYRVFVRGNRSINLNTNTPTPTTTTLRATGTLFTGNLVLAKPGGGGTAGMPQLSAADTTYSLVANPYAAVVNWKTVTKNDVSKNIYYFDPTIAGSNGRGGYVSYNELYDTVSNPSSNLNYFIQSGQAFFVRTTGPNPSITFRERDKASTHRPVFRPASVLPAISVRLMLPGKELTEEAADGLAAYFSDDLKTEIGEDDCYKFSNQDENIAILRNGKNLSIEGRKSVKDNDTLPLKMWQLTQKRYTLKVGVSNFSNNVESYLEDAWLATSTRLNNNHETSIPFSITSNAASSATDRFRIVFKTVVTLPVQMTGVKAYEKNKGVEVEWTAENESNIDRYEVEKSASAVQFATAGSVTAKNNGATASAYNWFDANVWTGDNFYRIKSVDNSGHIKYSQVVKVQVSPVKNQLPVSVNQVQSNSMNLVFTNAAKGKYGISLINSGGQKVYEGTISHAGGSTTNTIKINNSLAVGVYQMQVYYKNTRQNIPVLIQ